MRLGFLVTIPLLLAPSLTAAPANDEPANAITVPMPLPQTVQVDTTTATSNPLDPVRTCGGQDDATVWYRITPDFTDILLIEAGSFNAVVSVYPDGASLGPLSEVDCRIIDVPGFIPRGMRVPVTAGKTYLIEVSHYPSPGTLTLNFSRRSNSAPQLGSSFSQPFRESVPSGRTASFVITAFDPDYYTDVSEIRMLINSAFDSKSGCYVSYRGGRLYLLDDSGFRSTSVKLGSRETTENSQCILYGAGTYDVTFINPIANGYVSLGLSIAFKAAFAGTRNAYASVTDIAGLTSSNFSTPVGTFTVTTSSANAPPSIGSVAPNQGMGITQSFSFVFRDSNGADDITTMEAIINNTLDALNSCTIVFDRFAYSAYLLTDSTTASLQSRFASSASTAVENGRGRVDASGANFVLSGNELTVSNIAVTFLPAFAGPKTIWMVAQDIAGQSTLAAAGTWNVPLLPNAPPSVVPNSLTPASGSGIRQVFSASFSDPDGYSDLDDARITINAGTSQATGGCAVSYNSTANALGLWNDAGTAVSVITAGTVGVAENSQCYLFASGSSIDTRGSTVTFGAAITFKSSFSGNKNVYLSARDRAGVSSGIASAGTWSVPPLTNQPPAAMSVSPNSGTASQQIFTAVFSDPNGASDLFLPEILINSDLDGRLACLVVYDVLSDAFYVVNDSSTGSQRVRARSLDQAENGQCLLTGNGSSGTISGNTLTVTFSLAFQPSFYGARSIYLYAQDVGGLNTGLRSFGTWMPPAPANKVPSSVSATPGSAAGNAQLFKFTFTDPNGYGDMVDPEVIINSGLDAHNGCVLIFDRQAGAVRLLNDNAIGFTQVQLNSPQVTQNSSCILYGQGTLAIASGADLTLQLNLQFRSAFAGPKQIFMFVQNRAGQSNGIVTAGTYSVQPGIP